jgi:hypothetical protein
MDLTSSLPSLPTLPLPSTGGSAAPTLPLPPTLPPPPPPPPPSSSSSNLIGTSTLPSLPGFVTMNKGPPNVGMGVVGMHRPPPQISGARGGPPSTVVPLPGGASQHPTAMQIQNANAIAAAGRGQHRPTGMTTTGSINGVGSLVNTNRRGIGSVGGIGGGGSGPQSMLSGMGVSLTSLPSTIPSITASSLSSTTSSSSTTTAAAAAVAAAAAAAAQQAAAAAAVGGIGSADHPGLMTLTGGPPSLLQLPVHPTGQRQQGGPSSRRRARSRSPSGSPSRATTATTTTSSSSKKRRDDSSSSNQTPLDDSPARVVRAAVIRYEHMKSCCEVSDTCYAIHFDDSTAILMIIDNDNDRVEYGVERMDYLTQSILDDL